MNSSNPSDDQTFKAKQPPSTSGTTEPETEGPWSTGLFGCFDDVANCCMTCWCPCITFGQIAEIIDEGSTPSTASGVIFGLIAALSGCSCMYSFVYRSKLRKKYMLDESPCGDFLVHCFCEPCALCQEYRELKIRGVDPSIGWKGNLERQNYGVSMAPVVQAGMDR